MAKEKLLGIITRDVVTADENASAQEIAHLMRDHNIGVVVIVNGDKIIGVVSERDLTRRVVAENLLPENVKASEVMTREVVSVELKDGLNRIYQALCEIKFRHLLVTDQDKLIGITSRRDLLDNLVSGKR